MKEDGGKCIIKINPLRRRWDKIRDKIKGLLGGLKGYLKQNQTNKKDQIAQESKINLQSVQLSFRKQILIRNRVRK